VSSPERGAATMRVRKILAALCGAGLVLGLALVGFFNENAGLVLEGLTARGWQLLILGVMLVLGGLMLWLWRCPACGTFLGLMRTPAQCPRCGAHLR
jgi:hypothetical protein